MTTRLQPLFAPLLLLALSLVTGCVPRDTASLAAPSLSAEGKASPTPRFTDITRQAGIQYRWTIAGKRPLNILQTIGNGCAFLDYDGDGSLDILLVGPKLALYKGDGKGKFTDVTAPAGLSAPKGNFLGCAVGDYDDDGFPDVYVTAYRGGMLLHNRRGKGFEDVSKRAGIPPQPWCTSAAWADVNRDGKLDLFLGNYAQFGPHTDPQLCVEQSLETSCGPRHYKPEKNVLFLNAGEGRFRDVGRAWNLEKSNGKTLGAGFAPIGESGHPTLALANDEMPGDLMHNTGEKFENIGTESGTAYDLNGNVHGGMGLDWGDFDNDGQFDLAVCTFQRETKCIYRNAGSLIFMEMSAQLGMEPFTAPWVAFGIKWLDWDNDGWLDLAIANGHVQDNIEQIDKDTTYRQRPQLFRSENGKRFREVTSEAGPAFDKQIVGRGLATGDFDNEGRMDVLLVDAEGEPLLLHNETAVGHWAGFHLQGKGAEGATVTVTTGGETRTRLCTTGGSYMSASDPRVHFGLGASQSLDRVTVRWADGTTESWQNLPANAYTPLKRGTGKAL